MAAPITKKYSLNIKGILVIDKDNGLGIEIEGADECLSLDVLMADFADKTVKISVAYDEEYGTAE